MVLLRLEFKSDNMIKSKAMKAHCVSYKNIMQTKIKAKQNILMLLSNCTVRGKKKSIY